MGYQMMGQLDSSSPEFSLVLPTCLVGAVYEPIFDLTSSLLCVIFLKYLFRLCVYEYVRACVRACVYQCVCVCKRERQRQREREKEGTVPVHSIR